MLETVPVPRVSVFLLADNRLLREALVRILAKKVEINVVGATGFAPLIFDQLTASKPDVILFDSLNLAFQGPRLVATFRKILPSARIVMIGMERDENIFFHAVREGVVGYVLKDACAVEIVSVIRAVASGEAVCPPCFSQALFRNVAQNLAMTPEINPTQPGSLSRREQQIVGLVRFGLTNKEIATRLNLSERTVKNHVHRIFRKIGVHDRIAMLERCQMKLETDIPA